MNDIMAPLYLLAIFGMTANVLGAGVSLWHLHQVQGDLWMLRSRGVNGARTEIVGEQRFAEAGRAAIQLLLLSRSAFGFTIETEHLLPLIREMGALAVVSSLMSVAISVICMAKSVNSYRTRQFLLQARPQPNLVDLPPRARPYRVLVVEDDPASLLLMRERLPKAGVLLYEATSGEQAVALAADVPPDVALVDVRLPGIDGYETCRQLKTRSPDLLVILTTAYAPDFRAMVACGANDYLSKPIIGQQLIARVNLALRASRAPETIVQGDVS